MSEAWGGLLLIQNDQDLLPSDGCLRPPLRRAWQMAFN